MSSKIIKMLSNGIGDRVVKNKQTRKHLYVSCIFVVWITTKMVRQVCADRLNFVKPTQTQELNVMVKKKKRKRPLTQVQHAVAHCSVAWMENPTLLCNTSDCKLNKQGWGWAGAHPSCQRARGGVRHWRVAKYHEEILGELNMLIFVLWEEVEVTRENMQAPASRFKPSTYLLWSSSANHHTHVPVWYTVRKIKNDPFSKGIDIEAYGKFWNA